VKYYSPDTLAALRAGEAMSHGAVRIDLSPIPFRVWGGFGDLSLAGEIFTGVGDHGLAQVSAGTLGGAEQGATLSLSGVDPDVLALLDLASVRGAPVTVWRLIFDLSGSVLLSANIHLRGRADRLPLEYTPGGEARLTLSVEGATRGLGRHRGRSRTDADQRLILGTDGGMKHVSYAGQVQLNWGGKPPQRAGSALPNSGGAGVDRNNHLRGAAYV